MELSIWSERESGLRVTICPRLEYFDVKVGALMKPWMKIAIGCLAASTIAFFLLVAGLVGFGYWAKNKVQEVTGGGPAVEAARKTANAVPFAPPPGNVVPEDRLVQFIQVRASVFSVYEKYRGEIESRMAKVKDGRSLDFGDISTGLTLMGEIQRAESLSLAKHGMSEREYAFITREVYKSMLSHAGEAHRDAIDGAAAAVRSAADAAENLPPEAREAMARAGAEMAQGSREAAAQIEELRIAPENAELFKRYEAELKKYAMPGLASIFDEKTQEPGAGEPENEPGNTDGAGAPQR